MYPDKTLTPKEATRLCLLGMLMGGPVSYAALAEGVREFTEHVVGPSLDIMAPAIELLKLERLVTVDEQAAGEHDTGAEVLTITDDGREDFKALMTSGVRASGSEINDLIVALKFRYMHLLELEDQRAQTDVLTAATETELQRLRDIAERHAEDEGYLGSWLDREIDSLAKRLDWLKRFRAWL